MAFVLQIVLSGMFGSMSGEVKGSGENYIMRSLMACTAHPNTVRVIKCRIMRRAVHVALMVERRSVYRTLVGKPEGKRPLGRTMRGNGDNINADFQEVGYEVWTGLG
jgi:hypothetical protein